MSSVELARRLGTRQPTAWLLKHKLMAAMEEREAPKPRLAGRVEVDDAYLGGAALGRQARARCRRQDAVRGRRGDDGRAQAQASAADGRQRLPQEGDRGARQARLRRRQQCRQRRLELLGGGRAGRLHPLPDGHRQRAAAAKWVPFTCAVRDGARCAIGAARAAGSTRRWATSRRRSPAPTITSAPSTPSATLPASPGASTAATSSTA